MAVESPASELERFATSYAAPDLTVHRASVTLDSRLDGEEVTRIALLLNEPRDDTWDVTRIRDLREALGRRATELGLPGVTLTLVPESEADLSRDSNRGIDSEA